MKKQTKKKDHIHFIGIGGSGMSGLARIYNDMGELVTGSDSTSSHITNKLIEEGIEVFIGHSADNINDNCNLVIYSSAVPEDNPERLFAAQKGLRQLSYPEAVGSLTETRSTISVCGTHGKTTTTGMLAASLMSCGLDPTVLLGSSTPELGDRNSRFGKGKYFALESCEHFRNFLNYSPEHAIVTNIELDHLDYYKNQQDYVSAFVEFFRKLPKDGLLVANGDDPGVIDAIEKSGIEAISFGSNDNNQYRIINRDLLYKGKKIHHFSLSVPGIHNIYNAAGVFVLCHELNLDMYAVANSLSSYKGAERRFQVKGMFGNTLVIDDYAHHPTEITATIQAVREKYGTGEKVMCVFQPHQVSRTRFFLEDFSESFDRADHVIITDILPVRDSDEELASISSHKLVERVASRHPSVTYGGNLESSLQKTRDEAPNYGILLTLGAGDIWKISDALCKKT